MATTDECKRELTVTKAGHGLSLGLSLIGSLTISFHSWLGSLGLGYGVAWVRRW
ncbi:MAG TPA: hypothetical protein VFC58_09510 [Desulfosporosinus sp.]|nr:hypothetical protein [Desulfosporosinus sp.]